MILLSQWTRSKSFFFLSSVLLLAMVSIFLQYSIFPLNADKLFQNEHLSAVTPIEVSGYEIEEDSYELVNRNAAFLFQPENETGLAKITFSKPLDNPLRVELSCALEEGRYLRGETYTVNGTYGDTFLYIPFTQAQYSEIKIELGSNAGDTFYLDSIELGTGAISIYDYLFARFNPLIMVGIFCLLLILYAALIKWYKLPFDIHVVLKQKKLHALLPYLTLAFCILLYMPSAQLFSDDIFFGIETEGGIIPFVLERYGTWTSRFLIEIVLVSVARHFWLFRILQVLFSLLICYSIEQLLHNKAKNVRWMMVALFACYPISWMSSAGWVATNANYLWVMACALFAMIPIKRALCNERINPKVYPFYLLAFLYAANHEQMCALLLGVLIFFVAAFAYRRKSLKLPLVFLSLNAVMLALILLSPGNAARNETETIVRFSDFVDLTTLDKLNLGISSTLQHYFYEANLLFLIFGLILFIGVVNCTVSYKKRFIAAIPLVVQGIFGVFSEVFAPIFPYIVEAKEMLSATGYPLDINRPLEFTDLTVWTPLLLMVCAFLAVLYSLYVVCENKKEALVYMVLFFGGFCTRVLMGFSPTVWASLDRTFLFFDFILIFLAVVIYNILTQKESPRYLAATVVAVPIVALFNMVEML